MRKIQEYLDAAIENQELGSDSQLSRKLGLSSGAVHNFRTEKALPAPETMVKLARLAGIDEQVALVELSFMGAPEGSEAQNAYGKILKRISSFLPATLFGLAFMHPEAAQAAQIAYKTAASLPHDHLKEAAEMCITLCNNNVYYGKEAKTDFNKVSRNQRFTNHPSRCVSSQKMLAL